MIFNGKHHEQLYTPIKHVNITLEQLIATMENIVDERDTEIDFVLDYFMKYCFDKICFLMGING